MQKYAKKFVIHENTHIRRNASSPPNTHRNPPPDREHHVCEKKLWFILHFRTLGTFLVFTKMFTFWVVLWFVEVGTGDPPPPQAKNSHFIPFC